MLKSIGVAACVLCASGAAAKPVITEFDAPNSTGTYVSAVNAVGSISGTYLSGGFAYGYVRHSDDVYTYFLLDGAYPETINDEDRAGGYMLDEESDAFIAYDTGAVVRFEPQGTSSSFGASVEAMDNKAAAAGYYFTGDATAHGFLRRHGGGILTFDAPGAGTGGRSGTFVYGLTPKGIMAGYILDAAGAYHGFLRAADGSFSAIDVAGAGTGSAQGTRVLCMSKKGTVGGYYQTADNMRHGFLRDIAGNVSTFDVPGAVHTVVKGVNTGGVAAGFNVDANGASHGFERNAKGHIATVDAPDGGSASGQGTTATGISDNGEVVGFYFDSAGAQHGFYRVK
jgi:hypothetical protein